MSGVRLRETIAATSHRSIRPSSRGSPTSWARSRARSASRSRLRGDALGVCAEAGEGVSFGRSALAHANVREALSGSSRRNARVGAYDAKRVLHALRENGIDGAHFSDDAMIAAHLLDPSRGFAQIEDAAKRFLGVDSPTMPPRTPMPPSRSSRRRAPSSEARDSCALRRRRGAARAGAREDGSRRRRDRSRASSRSSAREVEAAAARLQQQIYDFAGEEFNIGSPQQLGNVLFGKLQIPGGKKTKTGWATGVEVLQGLAREYPICALVLEWREVTKLKNTYVDVIPQSGRSARRAVADRVQSDGDGDRAALVDESQPAEHPGARRARPAHSPRVRRPDDEYVLLAADYSQIELRLMAHLSGDEAMRAAFAESADIHDFTARQIFNVPPDHPVDGNQRRMAKSVNFGLFYGMSDFGLAQRLEIGRAEAKEMTTAYFARFPVGARVHRADDRRGPSPRLRVDDPGPPPLHAGT